MQIYNRAGRYLLNDIYYLTYFSFSAHGTFIGAVRLEANKPTQLPVDSIFKFGESTRKYILRERPKSLHRPIMEELEKAGSEADGGLLGLPETENELDNLTEFNTAQNRRISMLGIAKDPENFVKKKRRSQVTFNEEEDVINPEDIDPSIGKNVRYKMTYQTQ